LLNRIKTKLKSNFLADSKESAEAVSAAFFGCADELIKSCVSGWVSYVDESKNPVVLKITKGDEVKLVLASDERGDVFKAGLVKNLFCGYSVQFSDHNFDTAVVEVLAPLGTLLPIGPSYKHRKLFFIHIPKAAGSSINELISSTVKGGYYTHIEGLRNQWDDIKESKFLSGHIRYKEYESDFSKHDYVVFAFFREPLSHLKSHINWVRRLAEPELTSNREAHTSIVHKIADDLADINFSDIQGLRSYVDSLRPIAYGLFDNCQVRFLSGVEPNERVSQKHLDQAIKNLHHLHFVGISEYSKESQEQLLTLFDLDKVTDEAKINVNTYDFGLNIDDENVSKILQPLVKYDVKLYEEAKKIFFMQRESIAGISNV
jgi:hypothetical protein